MYGSVDDFYQKTVAVDYDDTISHHDSAWLNILKAFELTGYRVIIVTYRRGDCCPEDLDFLVKKGYKVYFTWQRSKRQFMLERGIKVDIWVDDSPESIIFDYSTYHGKYDVDPENIVQ